MGRKRKLIDKQATKHFQGKCYFCPVDDYACLNVHRIVPGENGGTYTEHNTVVCCANCHNKIHDGQIKIDRKYASSSGKLVLHFWEGEVEYWK